MSQSQSTDNATAEPRPKSPGPTPNVMVSLVVTTVASVLLNVFQAAPGIPSVVIQVVQFSPALGLGRGALEPRTRHTSVAVGDGSSSTFQECQY